MTHARIRVFPWLAIVSAFLGFTALLPAVAQAQGPDRGGFTLLLDLGVGFQHDDYFDETETGLAGLNLGIGGFLSDDVALMFRAAGTNVDLGGVNQVSGFGGPALQYWPNESFSVEAGVGVGIWSIEEADDTGLGLLIGAGYAFFNRGKHNLHVGVFYAPTFTQPELIHNLGLVFGWQLL